MHLVNLFTMSDYLGMAYPRLAQTLRKHPIATLPTPLTEHDIEFPTAIQNVVIKHDEHTSSIYGGNKIRKLEYIIQRARDRGAERLATFGAVGSNHALATAIHAHQIGLQCTCFLAHQVRTPDIRRTLNAHLQLGTEIVRYGGGVDRINLYRRYLQGRNTWVVPLGGTCWLGAVGFVNAGLELAQQLESRNMPPPQRIYLANGTMGSVAGLAIGLALTRMPTDIHAIRVADNRFTKREMLDKLIAKTASMLRQRDASIPSDLAERARIVWRDDFFAGGYATVDDATTNAVSVAQKLFDLKLDTTYTGKAMAAMLADLQTSPPNSTYLFWNTYNAQPLPKVDQQRQAAAELPAQFRRYLD